jgi:hypothetical protein
VSGFEIGEGGEGVKKKRRGGVGTLGWRGEAGNGRIFFFFLTEATVELAREGSGSGE